MPSLLKLLTISLLLYLHYGNGAAKEKPWEELSVQRRLTLLKAKRDSIGCYGAVFRISRLLSIPAQGPGCEDVCKPLRSAWKKVITKNSLFGDNLNLCFTVASNPLYLASLQDLGPLGDDSCPNRQCDCGLDIQLSNIHLSKPNFEQDSHPVAAKKKGQIAGMPSEQKPFERYGTKNSPYNCNASGFAPWLQSLINQHEVPGPFSTGVLVTVTFHDVVLDLQCNALTRRLPPKAGTRRGLLELFEETRNEFNAAQREYLKERKLKKAGPANAEHAQRKKRPKKAHKCSARPPSAERLVQLSQTCPAQEPDSSCHVPAPNEATSSNPPANTAQIPESMEEDFWKGLLLDIIEDLPSLSPLREDQEEEL